MQSQVPQFIEIEDRVIGPLTVKQTLYLAAGGIIIFVFWFIFDFALFIVLSIPVAALAAGFAFLKINGRPLIYFLLNIFGYTKAPKVMVWKREEKEARTAKPEREGVREKAGQRRVEESPPSQITKGKIKDLSKTLDIY